MKLAAAVLSALVMYAAAPAVDTRVADAAMQGNRELVRTLLKQAVDVNAAQGDGMTALHWAASKDDTEMAQLLLSAGANVRATTRLVAAPQLCSILGRSAQMRRCRGR